MKKQYLNILTHTHTKIKLVMDNLPKKFFWTTWLHWWILPNIQRININISQILPKYRRGNPPNLFHKASINLIRFPDSSASKESACNADDIREMGWIPGSGRSPGEGNGNPLQYCCLKNPMDRGAWQATAQG